MYEGIDFTKVIAVSNRHLSRLPYLAQVERILRLHPKAFLLREKDLGEEACIRRPFFCGKRIWERKNIESLHSR